MRKAFFLIVVAGVFALASTSTVSARGAFDLFGHGCGCDRGCDSCDCDACDCDTSFSDTPCCDSQSCCASDCDSGCGGGCQLDSHSLGNLFRRDRCCGSYCSLFGGWSDLDDYVGNDFEIPIPPPSPAIRRGSFNDGWTIGAAHGVRLNRAVRGELEFAFRSNTADQWNVNSVPFGDWSGHFYSYSIMANIYHDFANAAVLGWTPYVGGGIGIAFLDGEFSTSTLDLEIQDEEFAYQFIVGGSKSLASCVDLFAEYRYFATTNFNLMNNTPAVPVQFGEDPYEADNVVFGLRFRR